MRMTHAAHRCTHDSLGGRKAVTRAAGRACTPHRPTCAPRRHRLHIVILRALATWPPIITVRLSPIALDWGQVGVAHEALAVCDEEHNNSGHEDKATHAAKHAAKDDGRVVLAPRTAGSLRRGCRARCLAA